jgi:hypothetical protein
MVIPLYYIFSFRLLYYSQGTDDWRVPVIMQILVGEQQQVVQQGVDLLSELLQQPQLQRLMLQLVRLLNP